MYIDWTYRPYPWNTGGSCPNCGYCPCCGQARHTAPSYPWATAGTTSTGEVDPAKVEEWRKKLTEMQEQMG